MRVHVAIAVLAAASCSPPARPVGVLPAAATFVEANEAPVLLLVRDGASPVELWPFDLPAVSDDRTEVAFVEALAPPAAVVRAGGGPGATLITRHVDTGEIVRRAALLSPEETLLRADAIDEVRSRVDAANAALGERRWTPMLSVGDLSATCEGAPRPLRLGHLEIELGSERLVVRDDVGVLADVPARIAQAREPRLARVHVDRARTTLLVAIAACGDATGEAVHRPIRLRAVAP